MIISVTLNPALNKTIFVQDFQVGCTRQVEASALDPGGRGVEVAKAVCALGGNGVVIGTAGGAAGEYIRDQLDILGVQNDLLFHRVETRTNLRIIDAANRSVTRICEPGVESTVQERQEIWEKLTDLANPGDTVLFAGEDPYELPCQQLAEWISFLQQEGVRVALDTGGIAMKVGVAACPDLIMPSPAELAELCERELKSLRDVLEAARRVAANGVSHVVVPLAGKGALFVGAGQALHAFGPLPESPDANSAMLASVLLDLEQGRDWPALAARAIAAAAAESQPPVPEDLPPLLEEVQLQRYD